MTIFVLGSRFARGAGSGAAWRHRLNHLRFRTALWLRRIEHRCDLALRAWGARRLAREMQNWPDERLRDIGLSRAELAGAIEGVRRPFRWVPDHDAARLDSSHFGH